MRRVAVVVVLAGCGRIGFGSPAGDDDDVVTSDAQRPLDAPGSAITAPGDTCALAPTITIGAVPASVPLANQSVAGLADDYPPFIVPSFGTCSSGIDGVYRLDLKVPARVGFAGRADFTGSIVVGSGCPVATMNMCATLGGGSNTNSFNAGTLYVVVERQSGAGTTFDLTITAQ